MTKYRNTKPGSRRNKAKLKRRRDKYLKPLDHFHQAEHDRVGSPRLAVKCECGKTAWSTRKLAAAALSAACADRGDDKALFEAHPCRLGTGVWHYGHRYGTKEALGLPVRPHVENRRISHAGGD